jgi:NADPH:quinone reductase-like Zn-dependent oxidoreductase
VRTAGIQGPAEPAGILREIAGLIESGEVKPEVGRMASLDDASQAHAPSESNHGRGRIVLHIAD